MWRLELAPDAGRAHRLAPCLSPDERARAARFHFANDALRYTIARAVLRTLLGRYCGTAPEQLPLAETEHGRPYLAGAASEHAADGLDFNLSHSRDLALFAFVRDARIGVDLEWITPLDDMAELVEINFAAREQRAWRELAENRRERGFFDCWTRKEAFVKAVGEGLSFPLDRFEVRFGADASAALERLDGGDPGAWSLHALHPAAGYAAALAVEAPSVELRCWSFDPDATD